jgi:hypothetical protein
VGCLNNKMSWRMEMRNYVEGKKEKTKSRKCSMWHIPSADCLHVRASSSYDRLPRCSWKATVYIWTHIISGTNRRRDFMMPRVERRKSLSVSFRVLSHPLTSPLLSTSHGYGVSPLKFHRPPLLSSLGLHSNCGV